MPEQVPFIGREKELARIDELAGEWGTLRFLCISASGGIGKTRLLQEVSHRYLHEKPSRLLMTEIIDFDDHRLHLPENVGRKIGQMLDPKAFELYFQILLDYRKMELAGVSSERLTQSFLEVDQTFIKCFNNVATQKRIILLLDTTDALQGTDFWRYLEKMGHYLANTLILLAGRNAQDIGQTLQSKFKEDFIEIIVLPPLQDKAGKAYLQQKQKALNVDLEPELVDQLLILSGGKPILIDLAVEWRARGISLDWLTNNRLETLIEVSDDMLERLKADFEKQLVLHIAQTRSLIDHLVLIMSYVYPLDMRMLTVFFNLDESEAQRLFNEATTYVFVKSLPDGRIVLHDEMRRLINTYVWPEVDPEKARRRHNSQIAADYLQKQLQTITHQIAVIEQEEKNAAQLNDAEAELHAFTRLEALERDFWILKEQHLQHVLLIDIDQGVELFISAFDEATQRYQYSYRTALLVEMQKYYEALSASQLYEFNSRRVKTLLDRGEYTEAKNLVTDILQDSTLNQGHKVEMLIELGNIQIRLGNLTRGIADFEDAVQISRKSKFQNWLVRSLNARGWAYRNLGDFDKALNDYLEAYQLSLQVNDLERTAWLLNNMGYVNVRKGKRQSAVDNCLAALDIWKDLGLLRGLGATYSTLGEVYVRFEQPTEAMNSFMKAFDIFKKEDDREWLSTVRCGRATVYLAQGELDNAEEDLKWALENGPRNLKPRILFYQSNMYERRGDFETAYQLMEDCRKLSRENDDRFFDYASFSSLIEIACELGQYSKWQTFDEEHIQMYADRRSEMDLRMKGSSLRRIADLAICNEDYEPALKRYKDALLLMSAHEVRGRYTIGQQIKMTDRLVGNVVPGNMLGKLGFALMEFCKQFVEQSPESLLIFHKWIQKGANND